MTQVKFNHPLNAAMNQMMCNTPWKSLLDEMTTPANSPAVNVRETEAGFHLEVAAPGLAKEDFKVKFEEKVLTISVKKEISKEVTEGKYTRKEFSFHSFDRSFRLPDTVDAEKISAKYENGILLMDLPFRDSAKVKPVRDISVN
jgi:HSP20 family protein